MKNFSIRTNKKNELIDITETVQKIVADSKIKDGFCIIYCPHTTAGITINESYDDSVKSDILYSFDKISPDYPQFRHMEGNSDAHVKSSIIGCSVTLIIENSQIMLGQWQGIFFTEFDGPRHREAWVKIVGS